MAENVTVKSGLGVKPDGGFPVAVFEQSEEYENGELFIADNKVHTVPATGAVRNALKDGRLVLAGGSEGDEFEPELDSDAILEVTENDTAESLTKRYTKAELVKLAEQQGVEVDVTGAKADIAETIIGDQ